MKRFFYQLTVFVFIIIQYSCNNQHKKEVDTIFLAQASMEGAKKGLKDFSKEIYTSPEFGIKTYLQNLKNDK